MFQIAIAKSHTLSTRPQYMIIFGPAANVDHWGLYRCMYIFTKMDRGAPIHAP